MRCNKCARPLLARDAKITDALESTATLLLECECGTVYSYFLEENHWIYGIGPGAGSIICERKWMRTDRGIRRWLDAEFYGDCCLRGGEPRTFLFILPHSDPRPWGTRLDNPGYDLEWFLNLPIGQWIEPVYSDAEES
jgi:hypothetical protein